MRYFCSLTVAYLFSLGLDAISDSSNRSAPQKNLFDDSDWRILRCKFVNRFSPELTINQKLEQKIVEIEEVCYY